MNREWFKNRANQKFKESIDLLNKVKDNIHYIHAVNEAYGYELDTEILKRYINESLELVKTNSIEGGTHKAVAHKIVIDGINVYCPVCTELIADTYQNGVKYVHKCPYCNQRLDWEIQTKECRK